MEEQKKPKIYRVPENTKSRFAAAKKNSFAGFIVEFVKITVICLAIIIPVRYFLIQPFIVKGESMEPNFSNKEYLLIDEISYRLKEPQRGDVIVFRYPRDPSQYYIKRIIGLPGESVEVNDGRIIVENGKHPRGIEIKEFYLPASEKTPGELKYTLGAEEYFVLGDNRKASSDSRVWGALPKADIVGRVWVRALPINKARAFSTPEYRAIEN